MDQLYFYNLETRTVQIVCGHLLLLYWGLQDVIYKIENNWSILQGAYIIKYEKNRE